MLEERIAEALAQEIPVREACYMEETISGSNMETIEFDTVKFIKCQFLNCDFTKACFYHVMFENCDFSNCCMIESYWKDAAIVHSKADGAVFSGAVLKDLQIRKSRFDYANFSQTLWENSVTESSSFREGFLSEVKFKKTSFRDVDFTKADFFKTRLKGMDFSDCIIEDMMISDQFTELAGLKINMFQAVEAAKLLGMKIV